VLANLHRAARVGGVLYLTLEEGTDLDAELDRAYAEAVARELPIVRREHVGEGTGGYHYYPEPSLVDRWLDAEGLEVIAEDHHLEGDWGYRHLLLRTNLDR
jgi:hypothetical protein